MYITIIAVILLILSFVFCYHAGNKNDKKKKDIATVATVVFLIVFFACMIFARIAGEVASYEAYSLEKGPNTVKLTTLPDNEKRPENQFVWTEVSLEGNLYYYYSPEMLDGSQKIERASAENYFIDKRDGEDPHVEIYFQKGLRNWKYAFYMFPDADKCFYVIVVPESEPVEDTFNLE